MHAAAGLGDELTSIDSMVCGQQILTITIIS